jgi:hypothetical protein
MFVESLGLYNLTRTAVATSGCDNVKRINVRPAVGIGGQIGVKAVFPSREISRATADGQAKRIFFIARLRV